MMRSGSGKKGVRPPVPQADIQITGLLMGAARDALLFPVPELVVSLGRSISNALRPNQIHITAERTTESDFTLHMQCTRRPAAIRRKALPE
ncbi:hypothetical protein RLO149_c016950 [Roseobacter litoralis Och 149]|uniref:Uncharacterized protein n=1 Tax=Roseobacter litoralis (strain ATCC 49566 / DSM 6996 / JCM 21268 / NBRC 15278 / OCh 149) TaxID=391595 RepID=F7ZHS7_ROSLO|nr:hypothetical protein RLO149_c016950 [Roseobacter litoralis Och 149]